MSSRRPYLLAALVLAGFSAVATTSVWRKTMTADEPIYVAAGLQAIEQREPRINFLSSPYLLKPWLALPLYVLGERIPNEDRRFVSGRLAWHWQASWDAFHRPGRSAQERIRWSRLMNILLTLATGMLTFRLGRRLGGPWLGFWGMTLFLAWPDTIAHGRLATLDMGITFLTIATLSGALPLFNAEPVSRSRLVLTGIALGLAFLAKTSAVTLVGFLGLAAVVSWLGGRLRKEPKVEEPEANPAVPLRRYLREGPPRTTTAPKLGWSGIGRVLVVFVVALLVLNAGFAFDGSLDPVADRDSGPKFDQRLESMSGAAQSVARLVVEHVPVPLPDPYFELLIKQAEIGSYGKDVFFHGELRRGSWWWFPPVALALKTPVAYWFLLVAGLSILFQLRGGWDRSAWGIVLGYPLFLLLFFMATDRVGVVRYFLPVLPLLSIVMGLGLLTLWKQSSGRVGTVQGQIVVLALLAVTAYGHVRTFPHYLSYLTEGFGGPDNCHRWLADSNCDWGQDLDYLAEALREAGHDDVALAYIGSARPADHGLQCDVLPSIGLPPEPGELWWYDQEDVALPDPLPDKPLVISTSLLHGVGYRELYAPLRGREPDEVPTPAYVLFLPPHERRE